MPCLGLSAPPQQSSGNGPLPAWPRSSHSAGNLAASAKLLICGVPVLCQRGCHYSAPTKPKFSDCKKGCEFGPETRFAGSLFVCFSRWAEGVIAEKGWRGWGWGRSRPRKQRNRMICKSVGPKFCWKGPHRPRRPAFVHPRQATAERPWRHGAGEGGREDCLLGGPTWGGGGV